MPFLCTDVFRGGLYRPDLSPCDSPHLRFFSTCGWSIYEAISRAEGREKREVKTKQHVKQVISYRMPEARHAQRRISHSELVPTWHSINKHSWNVF